MQTTEKRGQTTALRVSTSDQLWITSRDSVYGFPNITPLIMRISGKVWWFRKPVQNDDSAVYDTDNEIAYPPTKHRPCPAKDGSDLRGRLFPEPELGPYLITKLGPIMERKMLSRAQKTARANSQPIVIGTHHTLYYCYLATQEEHYSTTACEQRHLQFSSTDHANRPRAETATGWSLTHPACSYGSRHLPTSSDTSTANSFWPILSSR